MPGSGLPTGTVAFVFTDIEGSTRLAHEQPQAFTSLLQRHNQLLRSAFESGAEVGTAGDALFVAFSAIGDALSAAAAGQRMLAAEPWPDGVEVRVRMGVHVGVAEVAEDTYMGVEVHRAARICAAAHGGQVLVSQAAAQLHGASPALSLRSLGDYRLKDFDEPQELFQLGGTGLLERFPPPRTAEARVVSLPRESTSLVGRDRELAEIRRLVMDNRLTTLTGTGGSGKSRLAMRVARDLAPRFRGPVVFVSLAPLADADSAPSTLATALGLGGMFATWQDAIDVLRPQNALIVWDNAEHLPGLSLRLRELCDDCERLHCLVTSRSSLGVAGEQLYPVEPLAPDAALELLVDRARQYQPNFDPAAVDDELRSIAARLDGLPLALELAAARLRSLPAPALLGRLDRLLDLLGETRDSQAERQATIRATLQWSLDLLEALDQTVFASLSVFAGPARLEAVAHTAGLDEVVALDSLTRLIDASLVRLQDSPEPRYWMLEPVRQFAAERLDLAGDRGARCRMLEWYARATAAFEGEDERFVRTFRSERENILRALWYAVEVEQWDTGADLAFTVAGGVFNVAGDSGSLVTWSREMELNESRLSDRGRAKLALLRGPGGDDDERIERALERTLTLGDPDLRLDALSVVVERALATGDLSAATRAADEAVLLGIDPAWFRVDLPLWRATVAEAEGDPVRARDEWDAAERAARSIGDAVHLVRGLWSIAGGALAHNDGPRAMLLLEEALAQDATWESWPGTELALRQSAAIAAVLSDLPELAARHLQRALSIFDRVWSGDLFADLQITVLTASATLTLAGRIDPAADLHAWAAASLPDPPTFDRHAIGRQQKIVEAGLERASAVGRSAPLDRQQVLRLSLDEVATVLEQR
jgi:predicted ATPase/class 3 adenylate cyclase